MRRSSAISGYLLISAALIFAPYLFAEVRSGIQPESGLRYWESRHRGVNIRLTALLPDQTRAFFQARGFASKTADIIARTCVFQTIFRNDSSEPIAYNMTDWRVELGSKQQPIVTREAWERRWVNMSVSQEARIALTWSLLPTRQRFASGDYNWGMISFGLPPGAEFDLRLTMRVGEDSIQETIPELICAPESK
ncbi:MAG: hypothetical protein GY792_16505 [Gammaproteobacteria bacterium]|nr:hypothetical protein [Gammaproteobacteria bacterium]